MVTAFVLINIEDKQIRKIAEDLLDTAGVTEVYPVAGEYDFIVVIRCKDNQTLNRIVCEQIVHKAGVRHTKTLFALDALAKVDLTQVYPVE